MHSILAARTDFSIGESILQVEQLVSTAKELGAKAVAMTDTMTVTGMIDFTNRCKKADIKPIIGVRLRLVDDHTWRAEKTDKKNKYGKRIFTATAYVLSEAGQKAVFRLLTLANQDPRFYYVSRLDFADLYAELDNLTSSDLRITLGEVNGVLAHPDVEQIQNEIQTRLGHVYAPLIPVDTPYFARLNELAVEAIGRGAHPLVVRPALYRKDEADAADIMGAICGNVKAADPWFRSPHNRDFHVVGLGELVQEVGKASKRVIERGNASAGALIKEGLQNTVELVDAVTYEWSKAPVSLPQMAEDEFQAVVEECRKGFASRLTQQTFGHQPTAEELRDVYMPRLKYELGVLQKLNFSGYFLLVQDVVQFAKKNDILVGPGRGSVGGSLVAYLMGITDCDPLRFGLLFERFINPDRIDLPDADLDFMSARRHEVVEYLVQKYGAERVAGVSNFSALAAASSIRDVSRVMGLPEREYICSKYVPKLHGANVPLSDCAAQVTEIKAFSEKYPTEWDVMTRLEGTMRNYGQHAAGIVVGGVDLVERAVVERRKGESQVVNWDKRIVEDQGLVKMDILGLNTLDLINLTLSYIRERHGKRVNLMRIPLDDKAVLDNFAAGMTTAVFQFESGGMRGLLKQLGKDGVITFEDITAATALYRPGPMESGMMESFYLRKQGLEYVEYDHPLMEPILKETFGVMVYQEQVMQVARAIAGYSAPDADKLRKIMGKKLPEEMAKERGKFIDGCVATLGADPEWAGQLFDKIEGFAGYGFNKSHSVEYTLISYQSMWLKTNYPVEFFASALTLLDEEKLPGIIKDAARFGIEVSMPDINISTDRFEIATDVRLVIPFQRIKGISGNTTEAILAARQSGPFKNKQDFLDRVERRKCNVRHQDALDKVGAFCRIEPGQVSSVDPSRIHDLIELIPGLITHNVPINRDLEVTKETKADIGALAARYREAHGPVTGDSDGMPVKPSFGRSARFMVIQDCPGSQEEEVGMMGWSQAVGCVMDAMSEHDLTREDVYWTALVKRTKSEKQLTAAEIALYAPYLMEEIEILKPPVIVLLGSSTVRHFFPDFKGKASDQAGKIVYSKTLDANVVIGFSPGEIYFSPEKQKNLIDVFHSVIDLLP